VQSQYYPLGLLCAFSIRFKVLMQSMVQEASGKVTGWDEPVPEGTNKEFQQVVSHLAELRAITFPRAAKPRRQWWTSPCCGYLGTAPQRPAARWPS
jgi:hypothetical protein